jgi:hypothetical protein
MTRFFTLCVFFGAGILLGQTDNCTLYGFQPGVQVNSGQIYGHDCQAGGDTCAWNQCGIFAYNYTQGCSTTHGSQWGCTN